MLGFETKLEDLESVDPELYEKRIVYLRDSVYSSRDGVAFEDLGLTFVDDSNDEEYTQGLGQGSVELQPGGAKIDVTEETKAEYLQLFVEHWLLACIKPQVDAVREGLGVFVNEALRATLRKCCTVADIQLLTCGVATIDMDDWCYAVPRRLRRRVADCRMVLVRGPSDGAGAAGLSAALQHRLDPRPGRGFAALMGYSGQQQRLTLQSVPGTVGGSNLPTAATCFNTLRLPANYASEVALKESLCMAIGMAEGFHEGAVAEWTCIRTKKGARACPFVHHTHTPSHHRI